MRRAGMALLGVGVAVVVVSIVWMAQVFPSLKKIPADYDQTVDFEGTYSYVADGDFFIQALGNASVRGVLGSPPTLLLLSRPETQQLLASPQLPAVLGDPRVLAALANPAAAGQIQDPAILQLIGSAAFQALVRDANIVKLFTDREGLSAMLDPRMGRLLRNPANPQMVDLPVAFHRVRTAERTEGGTLFLHQDFSATTTGGQPLPQYSSTSTLAVDRESREYAAGGSEARTGRFAFPFDVDQDETYQIWITEAGQPLPAKFVREAEVNGLGVLTFQVSEKGLALPDAPKIDAGLPASLSLIADVEATFQTEEKSGITVKLESDISYRLANAALGNPVIFRARIADTAGSVQSSVEDARDVKSQLMWLGTVLPWVLIVVALALLGGGAMLVARTSGKDGAKG